MMYCILSRLLLFLFFVICQELLTRNKSASAEFLEANYDKFFSHYQNLLSSDNYVTRRQALKVNSFLSQYDFLIPADG